MCLIDLDTLGPMSLAFELGDAWRSWCNRNGENDPVAALDLEVFRASLEGYRAGLGRPLSEGERQALLLGLDWVSVELAARFAADALFESYFGWNAKRFAGRGEHNLVRARSQFTLHQAVAASRPERARLLDSTMNQSRRSFLQARALAWVPATRYPDPAVKVLDPSFAKYRIMNAAIKRLARHALVRGPGLVRRRPLPVVERHPQQPHHEVGRRHRHGRRVPQAVELRQRQHARPHGRLLTCEHAGRRVTRTEYDGRVTVLATQWDGKPLNSPNDIVCKSDGSIWFTDPPFGILHHYEGNAAKQELPTNLYPIDPRTGKLAVMVGDLNRPNGLAFSPDESKLYVGENGVTRTMHVYDLVAAAPSWAPRSSSSTAAPARSTASAATPTATCGAAGAWAATSSTA